MSHWVHNRKPDGCKCDWNVGARPNPELAYVIQQLCGQYGSGYGGEIASN